MVSIMPGIEAREPERTDSSSGSAASPNRLPISPSTKAMPFRTSLSINFFTASWPCCV